MMKSRLLGLMPVLAILIISRLLLLFVGFVASGNLSLESWVNWDGHHYLEIATQGYDSTWPEFSPDAPECNRGTGECQRNFAFFPLYPLLIRGLAFSGLDPIVAGVLLSNLFFTGAGVILFLLARKKFGMKTAYTAVFFLALFPFGYIFSALMTEALFLFLLLLAYYLAFQRKYIWAGVIGALLSATRNTGVLFLVPLLFLYWENEAPSLGFQVFIKKALRDSRLILSMLLVPLGLVLFMVFLNAHTNDPLAFIHIQSYWEKPVLGLNPLLAILFSLIDYRLEGSIYLHLMDLFIVLALAGLFLISLKRRILSWSLNNIMLWVLVPMSAGSLLAISRYTAVAFPIYLVLARFFKNRKYLLPALLGLSFLLLLAFTYLYNRGSWITV